MHRAPFFDEEEEMMPDLALMRERMMMGLSPFSSTQHSNPIQIARRTPTTRSPATRRRTFQWYDDLHQSATRAEPETDPEEKMVQEALRRSQEEEEKRVREREAAARLEKKRVEDEQRLVYEALRRSKEEEALRRFKEEKEKEKELRTAARLESKRIADEQRLVDEAIRLSQLEEESRKKKEAREREAREREELLRQHELEQQKIQDEEMRDLQDLERSMLAEALKASMMHEKPVPTKNPVIEIPEEEEEEETELTLNRRLKREQDTAFEESLKQDQERERKILEEQQRAKEEEQRQKEMEEDSLDAKEEADAIQLSIDLCKEKRSKDLESTLPVEPEPQLPNVTHIVVRMPDGHRVERRFFATDKLRHLKHFVASKSMQFNLPDNFDIVTDFPKKVYKDLDMTFAEAGLSPRALVSISQTS